MSRSALAALLAAAAVIAAVALSAGIALARRSGGESPQSEVAAVAVTPSRPPSLPVKRPSETPTSPATETAPAEQPLSQVAPTTAPPPPAEAPTEEPPRPAGPPPPGTRDKYRQPFASTSIWNMPIGSGAAYVPAGIQRTNGITVDDEYWLVTDASMPSRPVFTNATFGEGRCATDRYRFDINIPDDFVVHDAMGPNTPNNVAAILLPDGHTIRQMNPISRCEPGGPLTAGWLAETVDIYGPGIGGAHGGSGLSSIGGSLRLGELAGPDPVRHALKVNLFGHRFLSQAAGGFRWPAVVADSGALGDPADEDSYAGPLPALRMGSLLAIPRSVDIASLGLTTAPAMKLAWTLQNYGAYVVDDTSWNVHAFDAEIGVSDEFRNAFGMSMVAGEGPWYEDAMRLFSALAVVDNNAPESVGGGGTPLQPLAAPIGN